MKRKPIIEQEETEITEIILRSHYSSLLSLFPPV